MPGLDFCFSFGFKLLLELYLRNVIVQLNKPAAFTVDMTGNKGMLDARIIAPSGAEDQAIIEHIDNGWCY